MAGTRYLIISDIHANEEALESVLRAVRRKHYEAVWCMGDLVGYGASPNAVVRRLRRLKHFVAVRGNHDKVCIGLEDGKNFNASARKAALWTRRRLTRANFEFLASLPEGPIAVFPGLLLAHGSTVHEDNYIFSDFDAYEALKARPFEICFFGHTHHPAIFSVKDGNIESICPKNDYEEIFLDRNSRYLINPGSVGQPRDRNPHAPFAEYYPETRRLVLRRVPYNVNASAERIERANLPKNLGGRLFTGT